MTRAQNFGESRIPTRHGPPPGSWAEVVLLVRTLNNNRKARMTPQELIAQLQLLDEHRREVATALSTAYGEAEPNDDDALLLDAAERLISGISPTISEAREKLLTYLGARTLAVQLEKPGAVSRA